MYYSTVSFLFVCLRHAHRSRDDAGARPLLAARFFPFCLSVPAPVLIRQRNLTFTHLRPSSPHSNSAGRSHRRLGRACAMRLSKASEFGRDSAKGQSRRRALRPQSRRRRFLTWFPFRSLLSTVSTSVPIHHHGTALAHSSICRPRRTRWCCSGSGRREGSRGGAPLSLRLQCLHRRPFVCCSLVCAACWLRVHGAASIMNNHNHAFKWTLQPWL